MQRQQEQQELQAQALQAQQAVQIRERQHAAHVAQRNRAPETLFGLTRAEADYVHSLVHAATGRLINACDEFLKLKDTVQVRVAEQAVMINVVNSAVLLYELMHNREIPLNFLYQQHQPHQLHGHHGQGGL